MKQSHWQLPSKNFEIPRLKTPPQKLPPMPVKPPTGGDENGEGHAQAPKSGKDAKQHINVCDRMYADFKKKNKAPTIQRITKKNNDQTQVG